jgi:tetracycline 7-halogenase / FADH2 O2-dependent halogenase
MTVAPIEHVDTDVAVIGSGFAGSLVSLALTRRGRRVAMIERGRHPRFAIGESSTPLANLLLEELADRYELPRIRPFSKWGTWQRARPEVAGGLKRGFTFFFHRPGEPFADDREHGRQLLVAASPRDEVGDTHWYRPDFDRALAHEAESEGTIYLDETRLERIRDDGTRAVLEGTRNGRSVRISAAFVVDASGPRGFLHRALGLDDTPLRWLPPTQGLYAHFEDVTRWDRLMPPDVTPPYPPDDAALHHVFPGGWIWVLRFNNGITSAGAALTDPVAQTVRAGDGAAAWERLLTTLPSVRDQFCGAQVVHPFVHAPRIAFRTRVVWGDKWAMLPSAAGVIDPLLSTGFPLTLLGIGRLLEVLESTSEGSERERTLRAYAQVTQLELDATEQLVAALYLNMSDVPLFKRLSLLYFAAASFSEAARRLGRSELAPGFLLHAHSRFGPELRACAALAMASPHGRPRDALLDRIDRAIEPFDTAGLLDRTRRDWYPVLSHDLLGAASKLDSTVEEIHLLLERCGFVNSGETEIL